jgi:hypothetical protein
MSFLSQLLLSLLAPGACIYLLNRKVQGFRPISAELEIFQFCSSWFLSMLLMSSISFIGLFLPQPTGFLLTRGCEVVFAAMAAWLLIRSSTTKVHTSSESANASTLLLLATGGVLGFLFVSFYLSTSAQPIGYWDAWAIWNQRAKFIFTDYSSGAKLFESSPLVYHLDYPLFLPLTISRFWQGMGHSNLIPALFSLITAIALCGLIFGGMAALSGSVGFGLVALILACGHPLLIEQVGFQVADIPLAFTFCGAVLSFLMWRKNRDLSGLFFCGVFCGAAPWIKNEGLLFCFLAFALGALGVAIKQLKFSKKEALLFALGAFPGLVTTAVFKACFAPPGDVVAGISSGATDLSVLITRGERVIAYVVSMYTGGTGLVALLGLSVILIGAVVRVRDWTTLWLPAGLVAGMHLGYLAVYVTSPQDIDWYLLTSANRLFVQLWPMVVVVLMLGLGGSMPGSSLDKPCIAKQQPG